MVKLQIIEYDSSRDGYETTESIRMMPVEDKERVVLFDNWTDKEKEEGPTLCLNMIVKNESKIITRLLDSVVNIIDSYCICDTGSTDDTPKIIHDYFVNKGIPGRIVFEPFRDFGHNRSVALQACLHLVPTKRAEYILLLDADMVLRVGPHFKKSDWLKNDIYQLFQGASNESYYYRNARIVRNIPGFKYWGVTHEYVESPPDIKGGYNQVIPRDQLYIMDLGDGGCKQNKYERDIQLLTQGLIDLPNNDRYTFYLANSYRDSGKYREAIDTYRKRIAIGGWRQEVWYSYYRIGKCHQSLGEMPQAISAWMEGYQFYNERLENFYEIVHYFRNKGQHHQAVLYGTIAIKLLEKYGTNPDIVDGHLFLQKDVYLYKLAYEMTISGYYSNPCNIDLAKLSTDLLKDGPRLTIPDNIYNNILSNYKFYSPKLTSFSSATTFELAGGPNLDPGFVPSTPSLTFLPTGKTLVNIRYVNYHIDHKGGYINHDQIISKNKLLIYNTNDFINKNNTLVKMPVGEMWMEHDHPEWDSRYVGYEDVRFVAQDGQQFDQVAQPLNDCCCAFVANRGLEKDGRRIAVEYGTVSLTDGKCKSNILSVNGPSKKEVEKNWVFADYKKKQMVYYWYPLQIGTLNTETNAVDFKIVQSKDELPYMLHMMRGSTNGVKIGSSIWFLCHAVSFEDRRFYYHSFVVLNADTLRFEKCSQLFTFTGEKVEYALGMDINIDLFIGFSTMDNSAHVLQIPLESITHSLHWIYR